jgi:hypothetical protein
MKIPQIELTCFVVYILVFFNQNLLAQSTPKYSNDFLSIGVGARSFGMANSVVASVDDVTASYWNPSGLTKQKEKLQISFMHSNYFSGIANYDYLGISTQVNEKSALSFSMVRFGVDNIPNTLDLIRNGQINYNRITSFSSVDYGFFVSYAQKALKNGLSFGGSAKIVHRQAGDFASSWGFGIDMSSRYESKNNWTFALMARDITTTFNAWSYNFTDSEEEIFLQTNNEIPQNSLELTLPKFIFGVAKKMNVNDNFSLLAEMNLDVNTDGQRNTLLKSDLISGDPHLGLECGYRDVVFLRAGVGNIQQKMDLNLSENWTFMPNLGVGVKFKQVILDYALSDIGNQSSAQYSHVFSIRASINPKP